MALNVFPCEKGDPLRARHFIVRCIEYQGFLDELIRREGMEDWSFYVSRGAHVKSRSRVKFSLYILRFFEMLNITLFRILFLLFLDL